MLDIIKAIGFYQRTLKTPAFNQSCFVFSFSISLIICF